MHPEDIKAELKKVHGSVRAFERANNLNINSVRDVLRGRLARKPAEALSIFLKQPMSKLFPGHFGDKRPNNTSHKRDAHRLTGPAA